VGDAVGRHIREELMPRLQLITGGENEKGRMRRGVSGSDERRAQQSFFDPRAPPAPPPPEPEPAQAPAAPEEARQQPNRIDKDYLDPTPDDPLPGVDMSRYRVPEMFRLPMGRVLHELRAHMQAGQ
jgi:hypothetical protein